MDVLLRDCSQDVSPFGLTVCAVEGFSLGASKGDSATRTIVHSLLLFLHHHYTK